MATKVENEHRGSKHADGDVGNSKMIGAASCKQKMSVVEDRV